MYDDDLDPAIRRRRKLREQAKRRRLIAICAGGAVAFVVLVVLVVKAVGPSAGSEGKDWTHRELADHLVKQGVPVRMLSSGRPGAAYLVDKTHLPKDDFFIRDVSDRDGPHAQDGVVRFTRMKDADDARRSVGEMPTTAAVYNWGPWVFSGDRALLGSIRDTLR